MNPILCEIPERKKIAEHIARKCLFTQPGELVLISGGIHQYHLLTEICLEVCKIGGHPLLSIVDDCSSIARVNEVPQQYLGKKHPAVKSLEEQYDVRLIIYPVYDPATEKKYNQDNLKLIHARRPEKEQDARTLIMEWPTPAKAKIYGMEYNQLEELYWQAFWVDLDQMSKQAQKIKQFLGGAQKVTITSADGSVLDMSIGSRPIWIDTGHFTQELIDSGDITKNLPCGEIYCSPLEDSCNGSIFFQNVFHQGEWIRDLRLSFEKGTITSIEAKQGKELFENVLSQHTGDKNRVAELGIGLNPKMLKPMGNTLLDEKVVGSIHLAIGRNTMYGGINKSTLHWDLVSMSPTVIADGNNIMTEGKLLDY